MEENIKEVWSKVDSLIDPKAVIDLALTLGNIDSPAGQEAPAGDYLLEWLKQRGLAPRKIGLVPDRFCVAGCLPGTGGGLSLLFNAHMDTSIPDDGAAGPGWSKDVKAGLVNGPFQKRHYLGL